MEHAAPSTTELSTLEGNDYVSLRTHRPDGSAVDSPMWFAVHDGAVVMRTPADSPKARRLQADPSVVLRRCDWQGAPDVDAPEIRCRATVLDGKAAEEANVALHRRYGWRWNVVPMIPVPGVRQAKHGLSIRGRLRMMRHRRLWPTSVIVRCEPLS